MEWKKRPTINIAPTIKMIYMDVYRESNSPNNSTTSNYFGMLLLVVDFSRKSKSLLKLLKYIQDADKFTEEFKIKSNC